MEKIINNSFYFVIAYLFVFAVVQISTILPAFSLNVPIIIYSSYLDFNTLTSAASDEVWKSVDNIVNIFGSGIILLVLLMFISIVLLLRWKSKKVWIQRLLFWVIICSFIRFCNGFICGHIFYLWGFNLVTDFIGLTFPSNIMKVVFVIIMFVILGLGMYFLREIIVGIIDPCKENIKKEIKEETKETLAQQNPDANSQDDAKTAKNAMANQILLIAAILILVIIIAVLILIIVNMRSKR